MFKKSFIEKGETKMTVIGNTVVMVFEETKMAHDNMVKKATKRIKK